MLQTSCLALPIACPFTLRCQHLNSAPRPSQLEPRPSCLRLASQSGLRSSRSGKHCGGCSSLGTHLGPPTIAAGVGGLMATEGGESGSAPWAGELAMAVKAARLAGDTIRDAFYKIKAIEEKLNNVDLVTETDKKCEDLIISTLLTAFPTHKFIGEESSSGGSYELTDDPTWIIDPLDGTTNFIHRYPFTCVSIGLVVDKTVVVGVVYNPILQELYTATKGGGAFLNDASIQVSPEKVLSKALVATEIGVGRDALSVDSTTGRIAALMYKVRSIRCSGSCAMNLASVASGRLDAFYEINFGGPWDVAAGALLVEEAGGSMLDPVTGGPLDLLSRRCLGANASLGPDLLAVLASVTTKSDGPPSSS